MSMDYGVRVTHFIKLPNNELVDELYEKFEDEFVNYGDSHPNILLANSSAGSIFNGDRHDETEIKKINVTNIGLLRRDFESEMSDILEFLDERTVSYSIDFGVISFYS